jgi:hypothetical protein
VHDSVDCLSPDGERNYISQLLCSFIDKIDYERDLEQQLNFYVECRAVFCNLDAIKDKLIINVSGLAMKTLKLVKNRHSKKTSTFVKGCLAYCHITIPSLDDVYRKLQLLLHCAQVALMNQCLPQTDTFLKAAISLIPDMHTTVEVDGRKTHCEEKLFFYLSSLLSTLVATPGHPEHGPFYIVQGLINAVPKYGWQAHTGVQTKVYINMLSLLCTYAQKKFPYHIVGVESNDVLYCNAVPYVNELNESIQTCVEEILKQLAVLGEKNDSVSKVNQAVSCLDLINQLAQRMELNNSVENFLIKLFELVSKNKSLFKNNDAKYFQNSVHFVMNKIVQKHNTDDDKKTIDFKKNNNNLLYNALQSYLK